MADVPMLQRLVQLTTMLTVAGDSGWSALELADALGYKGVSESRREALARDIRSLRKVGIEIDNVAAEGSESRWVLRPRDSRVRLEFSPEELAELARAAVLAGSDSLPAAWGGTAPQGPAPLELHIEPPAPELDKVLRAVSARCRLAFVYNGVRRDVAPHTVTSDVAGWSVTGFDHARGDERTFSLRRMSQVQLGPPGGAGSDPRERRDSPDPLRWPIDEPLTARLRSTREYAPDVAALLHAEEESGWEDDSVTLTTTVTNRLVFLARVVELGTRVELLEPQRLRDQLDQQFLRPEGWEGPPQ